jgi:hypothetical protein
MPVEQESVSRRKPGPRSHSAAPRGPRLSPGNKICLSQRVACRLDGGPCLFGGARKEGGSRVKPGITKAFKAMPAASRSSPLGGGGPPRSGGGGVATVALIPLRQRFALPPPHGFCHGEDMRKTWTYFAAASAAGRVQPFLYFSNQARIAEALAADCEGRAAMLPWLAPGTLISAVGTPRRRSAV